MLTNFPAQQCAGLIEAVKPRHDPLPLQLTFPRSNARASWKPTDVERVLAGAKPTFPRSNARASLKRRRLNTLRASDKTFPRSNARASLKPVIAAVEVRHKELSRAAMRGPH